MRVLLYLLLAAGCVLAEKNNNKRNKLPFVADAVGNSLPPPSSVPATVGSPVNLLTPDRYEFYTFDESGELVKRLMTLEEIQAIVAAGEEAEGLVTFANENPPTVSFNINQPPYTKVHSVVTNVQNVLKAQMEAHKNKPLIQPTLDTPDVSDSWSLILPSIFGNTGVDIVLDKASGSVTPETETIEDPVEDEENSLSKEGNNEVISSSTTVEEDKVAVTEKVTKEVPTTTTSTTTTTTPKPTTTTPKPTTTTRKPTTTTRKPTTTTPKPTTTTYKPTTTTYKLTTTTRKPSTTTRKATTTTRKATTTTSKPTTTTQIPSTTVKIPPSTTTTTTTTTRKAIISTTTPKQPTTVKFQPRPSSTAGTPTSIVTTTPPVVTTTVKPSTSKPVIRTTAKVTSEKPETTTKIQSVSILPNQESEGIKVQLNSNAVFTTDKSDVEYEKISTFIPVSTVNYITEHTTHKPVVTTKVPIVYASTTKRSVTTTTNVPITEQTKIQTFATTSRPIISTSTYISSTLEDQETDKINVTTITTQSVSPSTTMSSTELVSVNNLDTTDNKPIDDDNNYENEKEGEPLLPMFDVAQSISQIASDLGGNYQPIPTTSNLLDTTKVNVLDLESKEDLDMEIPSGAANNTDVKKSDSLDKNSDNFVKISTIDPHNKNENKDSNQKEMDNTIKETEVKKTQTNVTKKTETKVGIQKNDTKDTAITDSESTQNSTNDSEPNILINNIQKVEFLTTTIATEATTIDPILSESMGDLLSQVVNEAPLSIIDSENKSEEETKLATTQKSVELTTEDNAEIAGSTSEISNKIKKDTNSTTELPNQAAVEIDTVKENNFRDNVEVSTESNSNNNTDFLVKEPTEATTAPNDSHKESITMQNETEDHTQNFVQISVSTNNNDSKEESVYLENKNNTEVTEKNNNETRDGIKQESTKNGNKSTEADTKNMVSTEATTPLSELDITTTSIPHKNSQSKFNKINLSDKININNKKDKLPELLPKIDDYKKKIQKVNIDEEELINERNNSWKLIPTLSPPKANEIPKDKVKSENHYIPDNNDDKDIVLEFSKENQGLEVTTRDLGEDIARFSELSNELSFRFWNVMIDDIDKKRSFVLSPYSIFSMLAMIFMGARGATSGEMNEILKLDDMVTFNPHFTLKNISDSIEATPESGVAVSAFIRELYSDRNKGKILTFYKERAQHFYNGHVEEINFKLISDIIRRRTNLLVKRYTWGKIPEYMKTNNIVMQPPLAAFTANIFETDCSGTSVDGRDGEMYFVVSPNVRQRRLVPVPAVVYKSGFLAGYDPGLDATAAALGNTNTVVSTLFLMPGQQGNVVHADDLEKLEQRLLEALPTTPTWNRVLRTLLPRTGLELQIPRFSHKSTFNVSMSLRKMGLKDLFDGDHADLGGLNGPSKDLYLSDMVQLNTFATCGENGVGDQHHVEEYPETLSVSQRRRARWLNDWDEPRDYQRAFHDPHDISDAMHLPLHLRPRQARLPARSALPARLKFDRPFLYFVRHNPSGMILYFGRYNPRLLP